MAITNFFHIINIQDKTTNAQNSSFVARTSNELGWGQIWPPPNSHPSKFTPHRPKLVVKTLCPRQGFIKVRVCPKSCPNSSQVNFISPICETEDEQVENYNRPFGHL